MVTVSQSTIIDAPIQAVWAVLRDFNGHDRWHPVVDRSHVDDGLKTDQVGAVRNFVLTTGERIRERLLSLSDKDHSFRYTIVESDVPLLNYVAEVSLKPVTDGNRTFWLWRSKFQTPKGQEQELKDVVEENVYRAGFEAVRSAVSSTPSMLHSITTATGQVDAKAISINRYGGPEELLPIDISVAAPGLGEVRIRQTAIGVNYIDVYCRTGYFNLLTPPGVLGMEAAGVVTDVGSGVRHLQPGQRVAYACPPVGAYTSVRTMESSLVVPLPDFIDNETAAAGMLKGMTAEFLLHRVHKVQAGETVLVYAPAGGVGQLLCQWAKHLGARVIGATSTEAKARIARAAGADHVILPGERSLEDQVRDLTGGYGADVIFDAVGKDSFAHSVAALANCGHLVSFGQASGDIGDWNIASLASNSATISRPNFGHYTDTPDKVAAITDRLFAAIRDRVIKVDVGARYSLSRAEDAHRALGNRETTGSTVLLPDISSIQ